MYFQGNREQYYQLYHYQFDQFSWLLTRNEVVHRAQFPSTYLDIYIFRFETNDRGTVDRVIWRLDLLLPGGEKFMKQNLHKEPRSRYGKFWAQCLSSRVLTLFST